MILCARCDWQPTAEPDDPPEREQLRQHALDSGHPLCTCCGHSLSRDDPAIACERCLTTAREHLSGIATMWTELPGLLGELTGRSADLGAGSSEEFPLAGGTVLALLSPGSPGGVSRFGEGYEPDPTRNPPRWWVLGQHGPLTQAEWMRAERIRYGTEHQVDNLPSDTTSVQQELWSWVLDWSESGGPAAPGGRLSVPRLQGYLEVHARWAANQHEAFSEFANDMRVLHLRLEQATGRYRAPSKAGASCFDCGGDLVRPLRDVAASTEPRWWLRNRIGPLQEHEIDVPVARTGEAEADEVVVCRQCPATYDGARYLLALAARRQQGLDGWVPYRAAATAARRPVPTLWSWVQRLQVPAVCRVQDRTVLVWYPAVDERAAGRKNTPESAA